MIPAFKVKEIASKIHDTTISDWVGEIRSKKPDEPKMPLIMKIFLFTLGVMIILAVLIYNLPSE